MTCVFKWSGVAGGTGERWTMSINEAARTCSVGRDVSYLLFGHFHASFGPGGGEAEVTVYDGTGTEATRDREYVVEEKGLLHSRPLHRRRQVRAVARRAGDAAQVMGKVSIF